VRCAQSLRPTQLASIWCAANAFKELNAAAASAAAAAAAAVHLPIGLHRRPQAVRHQQRAL